LKINRGGIQKNDVYAFSEKEKEFMLKGAEIIDDLCDLNSLR